MGESTEKTGVMTKQTDESSREGEDGVTVEAALTGRLGRTVSLNREGES